MNMTRQQWILVLISGITSGCKSTSFLGTNEKRMEKTRNMIETAINDSDRRDEMLAIIHSLQKESKAIEIEALELRTQIVEMNRNYNSPLSKLEQLYEKLGMLTVKLGETARNRSLELRALCSPEEWKQIASHKTDAIYFTF